MRVIVVGAGPGGLAAAINLAGQGVDVTVVEKDPIVGGRMKGLTMGAYQMDTGPSILQLPQLYERLFERAGKRLSDYVTLQRLEPSTRLHFWDGTSLDTSSDPEKMCQAAGAFGKESAMRKWLADSRGKYEVAYEKFISTSAGSLGYYAPWRLLPTLKYKPWQTLYSHLNEYFEDDRLSYALAYPSKYLGLHPTTCSSVFSVIPYIEAAFGVWHVHGGFSALARGMQRCAEDLGARFRLASPVTELLVNEDGQATGVQLASGEKLEADAVVINADLAYAATQLIPERWRSSLSDRKLEKADYSCSTFMAYYGVDQRYDLPHHLIYLSESARRTDRDALEDRTIDLEDPSFYACNPSVTDPTRAPDGHSTLYVLVPTPNTSRGVDWAQAEKVLKERIPQWLEKVGIKNLKPHIREARYHTAETWRDDYNVFRGAVFNLSHTWLQLGAMRPRVKNPDVAGLYWVGGGTHPGSGLLTIMESANIAADYLCKVQGKPGLPQWPYVPTVAGLAL